MNIKPNHYKDLHNLKICDVCGFPVMNATSMQAKRCQPPLGTKGRSACQGEKERQLSAIARKNRRAEDKLNQYEMFKLPKFAKPAPAMRECLRCPEDENGVIPKFKSSGPFNRICPTCSNAQASVDITNLSRVSGDISCPVLFIDSFI